MKKLLQSQNALVTGGGRGIGKAVAVEFAKNGANVAVASRTLKELDQTVDAIEKNGVKGLAIQADLSTLNGTLECAEEFFKEFETCDILVNNAGMTQYAAVSEYPLDKVQKMFNLNILSYYAMIKHLLPKMLSQKKGKIILTSSVQGNVYFATNKVAYVTSKVAVSAMGKCLHYEVNSQEISVGVVLPGSIDTQMMRELNELGQRSGKTIPPEQIAPIYLYLASDLATRKYYGDPINQQYLYQVLFKIIEIVKPYNGDLTQLTNLMKEKLKKSDYGIFRKNKELIDFLLKYLG